MRYCKYCNCSKPFNPSFPQESKARGFAGARCWDCKLANSRSYIKTWQQKNPDKAKAAKDVWYAANPGRHTQLNKAWYAANPGRRSELTQRYNMRKRLCTPPWADLEKIKAIYAEAAQSNATVDHIVPITHPLVCGLHVHYNLQLLSKSENSSKNNKFEVL